MSHELKTKGNKVLSFSTLREGHDQEQKNQKEAESGKKMSREKKQRVRKKSV